MDPIRAMLCSSIFVTFLAAAAEPAQAAIETLEVKGAISSVNISADRAAPTITLQAADGKRWNIRLGSIRYLMENGFNPKAGKQAVVIGFKDTEGGLMAISVALPESGQKLQFRDSDGRPLWRGRGYGKSQNLQPVKQ